MNAFIYCCSCSCWMRKSAQKLCFLREFLRYGFSAQKFHFLREYLPFWENLPKSSVSLENICPFRLSAQKWCFLRECLPFGFSAQKICFLREYLPFRENLPKSSVSLENICPFCLSAQMFCFLTEYLPYWIICPISDYLPKIQKSAVLSCGCYSCCCRKLEKCKTPF